MVEGRSVALLYWSGRHGSQRKIQIAKSADQKIWVGLDNRWHSDLKQVCHQFKAYSAERQF